MAAIEIYKRLNRTCTKYRLERWKGIWVVKSAKKEPLEGIVTSARNMFIVKSMHTFFELVDNNKELLDGFVHANYYIERKKLKKYTYLINDF